MRAVEITNRIKEILSKYTDDFSDILSVSSLSRSGSTITCVTDETHGLNNDDYITIRGAKEPITISSLTRSGNIVTATTSSDHKLSDPSLYAKSQLPLYIEILGADSGYNGTWELVSVPDDLTFTFKITGTPTSPASTTGYLLLQDQDGYNGYKQVTVIDDTTFTYTTTNTSLKTPAQGAIELSNATRVEYAATPERIIDFYSANEDLILQNWMFVVLGGKTIFKDGTVVTDPSTAQKKNQSYFYDSQQDFSIYVVIPAKDSVLGGAQADTARSYEKPILLSLANYILESHLTEDYYQPCVYIGNETDDYVKAYYAHRFDFSAKGFIQNEDTAEFSAGVPLQLVDGSIKDKLMTYKPQFRQ